MLPLLLKNNLVLLLEITAIPIKHFSTTKVSEILRIVKLQSSKQLTVETKFYTPEFFNTCIVAYRKVFIDWIINATHFQMK